jgi:filamentous hemagglutinin
VTSTADVRGKLAISSEWKGQGGQDMYVIEFTAKPGVGVREGTVGPMFDAKVELTLPGGGHQVQFMDKSPRTNPELYQINLSNSRKLK